MRKILVTAAVLVILGPLVLVVHRPPPSAAQSAVQKNQKLFGIPQRVPWTTSRVQGSPEPPLPYRSVRVFPKLSFNNPLLITHVPGTNRLLVAEHYGKIFTFPNDQKVEKADLLINVATDLQSYDRTGKIRGVGAVYGVAFHPKFPSNRYCYICYVLECKDGRERLPDGTRVSRFTVTRTNPPRIDPASEKVIITWLEGGHNGGDLHFGPDGYLYISTGDGSNPNPPDALDTGQDLSDLLSSVLRIDVDKREHGKPYSVPKDNPFLKEPGARPEIWAYGFRNPWRMSFDRATGELWVADVGWELWETVHRVKRGGNYGWSVMEGPQPVRPNSRRGPTPITPPAIQFPHTESASITGGYVYRGKRYPKLQGTYICGDWETRRIWGARFDKDKVLSVQQIAQTSQRIVAFGEDPDHELYYVDYDPAGGVYQLVPQQLKDTSATFPRRLSDTGLFADVAQQQPAAGVVPFEVNAEQWVDHAAAQRWAGIPGKATVMIYEEARQVPLSMFQSHYFFPADSVLAKTLSLEMERGNPSSRRKIETQILHFDGEAWHGYTYRWNDQQTDAMLVDSAGANHTFKIKDAQAPGGWRQQTWRFFGRGQCLQCHNPWAGYNLAFNLAQLDRRHDYDGVTDNQLRALGHAGMVAHGQPEGNGTRTLTAKYWQPLVNPRDEKVDLMKRARSYLHVNCSHCHQFGAGGTALIDLRATATLEETHAWETPPVQGTFAIPDAQLLAPGDPFRSVLYYRMATPGQGRMPHIGSTIVDTHGLKLIHDWIRRLPMHRVEEQLLRQLRARRLRDRDAAIGRLLQTTSGALFLLRALEEGRVPAKARQPVIAIAVKESPAHIRDLFERFVPDDQKIKRLGDTINAQWLLQQPGDASRGQALFFNNQSMQCVNCHRIGDRGSTLGPDLSKIGSKLTRAKILESLLQPSKEIEPKYMTYLVTTTQGQVLSGLLVERNAKEVILRDVRDQTIRVPAESVEQVVAQRVSLMPEGLLRDLTATEAADLLAYLQSLK